MTAVFQFEAMSALQDFSHARIFYEWLPRKNFMTEPIYDYDPADSLVMEYVEYEYAGN